MLGASCNAAANIVVNTKIIRLPNSKLTLRLGTSSTSKSYVEDLSLYTIQASPF
jgi:hypothetical protein